MAEARPAVERADVAKDDGQAPKKKRRRKTLLRRPRGKRGGIKNQQRKPTVTTTTTAAAATAAPKKNVVVKDHARQIAHFHTLEKKIAQARSAPERLALVAEQEALGGLAAYQDASLFGADKDRGGETGKWCAQVLTEECGKEARFRLLDVGSLSGSAYAKYKRITPTSIDINPRSENVLRFDFFDFPVPEIPFDVVALSLVVNFLGDLAARGRMLVHAHKYLRPDGFLFLVLPLACVSNSRYLDHGRLRAILHACGWDVVRQDDSARLTRWLCRERAREWDGTVWKKEEIRKGKALNNFCILVR